MFPRHQIGYGHHMTDYEPSDWDPEAERDVEPDELVDNRSALDETDTPDAERILHEAGGDADRAEDIVESRRMASARELSDIPADERPVV